MNEEQQKTIIDPMILRMLEAERKDSLKARNDTQNAFLKAIEKQTKIQSESLNKLGDRFESSISEIRQDLRSSTNKMTMVIVIAMLVIASLAGVSVHYMYDGKSTQLDLNKIPVSIK